MPRLITEARLATGGEAIAYEDSGRIVFVENAAPEEEVDAEFTQEKKRFARARLSNIVQPSTHRVSAPCKHVKKCGGCSLQHLEYGKQAQFKIDAAIENIFKLSKIERELVILEDPWIGSAYGYRTRVRLSFAQGRIGYKQEKSHKIAAVSECGVLHPLLQEVLKKLRKIVAKLPRLKGEVIGVCTEQEVLLTGHKELVKLSPELPWRSTSRTHISAADGFGPLYLSPEAFSQANREGNKAIVETIRHGLLQLGEEAGDWIEYYSGSGNLTRVLSPQATKLHTIELPGPARQLFEKAGHQGVQAFWGDAAKFTQPSSEIFGILANPPRAGFAEEALLQAGQSGAEHFVYMSCNPASFARDVGRLAQFGYHLHRLKAFDLYPQTPHLEVLGWLSKQA